MIFPSYFGGFPVALFEYRTVIVLAVWDGQKLEPPSQSTIISEGSNGVIGKQVQRIAACAPAPQYVRTQPRWVSWNASELYGVVKEIHKLEFV